MSGWNSNGRSDGSKVRQKTGRGVEWGVLSRVKAFEDTEKTYLREAVKNYLADFFR